MAPRGVAMSLALPGLRGRRWASPPGASEEDADTHGGRPRASCGSRGRATGQQVWTSHHAITFGDTASPRLRCLPGWERA